LIRMRFYPFCPADVWAPRITHMVARSWVDVCGAPQKIQLNEIVFVANCVIPGPWRRKERARTNDRDRGTAELKLLLRRMSMSMPV